MEMKLCKTCMAQWTHDEYQVCDRCRERAQRNKILAGHIKSVEGRYKARHTDQQIVVFEFGELPADWAAWVLE